MFFSSDVVFAQDPAALNVWSTSISYNPDGVPSAVTCGPKGQYVRKGDSWGSTSGFCVNSNLSVDVQPRDGYPGLYDVMILHTDTVYCPSHYLYKVFSWHGSTRTALTSGSLDIYNFDGGGVFEFVVQNGVPIDFEIGYQVWIYSALDQCAGLIKNAWVASNYSVVVIDGELQGGTWLEDGSWLPSPGSFYNGGPGQPLYTVPVPEDPGEEAAYWSAYWDWVADLFVPSSDRVFAFRSALTDLRHAGIFGFVDRCGYAFRNPSGQFSQGTVLKDFTVRVGDGRGVPCVNPVHTYDIEFPNPPQSMPGFSVGAYSPTYGCNMTMTEFQGSFRRLLSAAMWLFFCGSLVVWMLGRWRN